MGSSPIGSAKLVFLHTLLILASNSVVECLTVNQIVVGSIPTLPASAILAQLVEQETFNLKVTGSTPVDGTKNDFSYVSFV